MLVIKNCLPVQERCKRHGVDPWVGKISGEGNHSRSSILIWESCGQRSPGFSTEGHKESVMAEKQKVTLNIYNRKKRKNLSF